MTKKSSKHYSQKMYLFVIYGSFILILLGIFFTFTYTYYRKNTLKEASKDLENMCASVADSVTNQLDVIATISMNIVYSNAIKTNFKEFSAAYGESEQNPASLVASRQKALQIQDIVTALIGAYQSASEINIYTLDGTCVEVGYWQRISSVDLDSLAWYEDTMRLNGHKYLTAPIAHEELPARGENQKSRKFISLVRLFLHASGQPEGIVEVIQDCDTIFSLASQLEYQNPGSRICIYNSRQELVYPYHQTAAADYAALPERFSLKEHTASFVTDDNGEKLLVTYQNLPDYQWTIMLMKPESAVYAPLRNFQIIFLCIGILSILLTMLICFYISRRLTIPLQKLTDATGKITINRVLDEKKINLTSADSNIEELSRLCNSIRDMYEKLRTTSQEVLLSRNEETRAKIQATQSFINPHFLYNSLTNMSVMAEEQMNEEIVQMCEALCDYFRYVSASGDMVVPLKEEIFYTKRYLECMQLRFSEEFSYSLELDESTSDYFIPKLILQPIVENAFKYAFQMNPPWHLTISAFSEHGFWIVRIEDNGGNLSAKKKQELLERYEHLDMNEELKSMKIGGMGLKNIYLRLKLLYRSQAIFEIDISQPGKTVFLLGGPIHHTREEYYEQHLHL